MDLQSPVEVKLVKHFDITLASGLGMPITIDESLGDTISIEDTTLTVYLSAKPSLTNPKVSVPAEKMTLYMRHVVSIQEREVEVVARTPEQEFQYQQTIQELTASSTIH